VVVLYHRFLANAIPDRENSRAVSFKNFIKANDFSSIIVHIRSTFGLAICAAFERILGLQEGFGDFPHKGQIFRGMTRMNLAVILTISDIQRPMQAVFYAPMTLDQLSEAVCVPICAADIISVFLGGNGISDTAEKVV